MGEKFAARRRQPHARGVCSPLSTASLLLHWTTASVLVKSRPKFILMTPTCSQCKRVIPDADVNVATDVAFCRACNIAHKLSSLVHGVTLDEVDLGRPPEGTWRRGSGIGVAIGATHRSVGMAFATLAFALFWNGIVSVFVLLALSSTLQHLNVPTPDWFPAPKMNGGAIGVGMTIFLWIFLTPFIAVGLAMAAAFVSALGGRTEIQIRQGEGVVFTGIGSIGWRRRFNLETAVETRCHLEVADGPRNPTAPQFIFRVTSAICIRGCNQNDALDFRGSNCRF